MVLPDSITGDPQPNLVVVLISADAEWSVVRKHYLHARIHRSPFGEWFQVQVNLETLNKNGQNKVKTADISVIFFQGGWGKIAAAASTQYVINGWKPELLINLGTCGGFLGLVERFSIFLVDETIVYDIYEQMGDPIAHVTHYSTKIDLTWLNQADPPPLPVKRSLLVSGDRDLIPGDRGELIKRFGASAGDWESGAIAFVARKNMQHLVILRGVTDLVGDQAGEAYQNIALFKENTEIVMELLLTKFFDWVLESYFRTGQRA